MQFQQWTQPYDCGCYSATEPTPCGGRLATQFCCRGCYEAGLEALRRAALAQQQLELEIAQQELELEMDRIVEPPAPPSPKLFPGEA